VDALVDAVMRAVRKKPRSCKAGHASAAGVASGLAAWPVALGTTVALIVVLVLARRVVLSALDSVHEALSGAFADRPSHVRPRESRSTVRIPGSPRLPDAASTVLGAHELRPMDGYGQQLYEAVSRHS
jgi:hypothetical protein